KDEEDTSKHKTGEHKQESEQKAPRRELAQSAVGPPAASEDGRPKSSPLHWKRKSSRSPRCAARSRSDSPSRPARSRTSISRPISTLRISRQCASSCSTSAARS